MKSLMRSICFAACERAVREKVTQARLTLQSRNGDVAGVADRRVQPRRRGNAYSAKVWVLRAENRSRGNAARSTLPKAIRCLSKA